jgi:hypothetical protein
MDRFCSDAQRRSCRGCALGENVDLPDDLVSRVCYGLAYLVSVIYMCHKSTERAYHECPFPSRQIKTHHARLLVVGREAEVI